MNELTDLARSTREAASKVADRKPFDDTDRLLTHLVRLAIVISLQLEHAR